VQQTGTICRALQVNRNPGARTRFRPHTALLSVCGETGGGIPMNTYRCFLGARAC
jgi:hypothetical protein